MRPDVSSPGPETLNPGYGEGTGRRAWRLSPVYAAGFGGNYTREHLVADLQVPGLGGWLGLVWAVTLSQALNAVLAF